MSNITIEAKKISGQITPPADKSISHRAVIIASIASGKTQIKNLSSCEDCLRTIDAFKNMGIAVTKSGEFSYIEGRGLIGLHKPKGKLYLGNSGTSMRLLLGILAAQRFSSELEGDASLSKRPMKRVIEPLSLMGAEIKGRQGNEFAPLTVRGRTLKPISYEMPIASAQVKSAILLAGLYAEGITKVIESAKSRDHTERMLKKFGADISPEGLSVSVSGRADLIAKDVDIPGDASGASFFLVAACISKGSRVSIKSVGLNPTRTAFLNVLQKMGASIRWNYENDKAASGDYSQELKGEITAKYSSLKAFTIGSDEIPSLIDELPILMVAATQAEGESIIAGADELRVKETDRINSMISNLTRMKADIESRGNDIIIRGPSKLSGSIVESFGDHRTAMCMAVAALCASGRTTIKNTDCVFTSYPNFFEELSKL
ncbi:MAG: 3-phosphoshikimate 1-carboxyvinyltransferase [Candidatus Omnitrophota bacterium]|nr:MAG: 3-phosphoshikimate 1-carboxyvinyltransferase [Candidatus Omnitrophota bacterium]